MNQLKVNLFLFENLYALKVFARFMQYVFISWKDVSIFINILIERSYFSSDMKNMIEKNVAFVLSE